MKRVLSIFLLVASFFNLYACSNDNLNKDNPNNQRPNISTEEIKPTVIELTKNNYGSYLNISITQIAQSQTLISNTYHVKYRYGSSYTFKYYTGLTPPTTNDVLEYSYLWSKYSVSTTFTIDCHSKNKDYVFSNSSFTILYRPSSSSEFFSVGVYISREGNGSNIFMMSEELSTPNKSYSLQVSNMIRDFNGEVSFFNNN